MRRIVSLALVTLLLAACSLLGEVAGARGPRECGTVFSPERCEAILVVAAEQLQVPLDTITRVEVAPDPTPRSDGILQTLGGARPLEFLVHLGSEVRTVSMCGGIPSGPACTDQQELRIGGAGGEGYRDVPCAGEPPDGCATPLPPIEPGTRAAARPLVIEHRSIPIPKTGRYEIVLGRAGLPNGILTRAQGALVDPWPDDVRLSSEGLWIDVRSTLPDRPPFVNYYEHGWWPGVEEVEAILVFDVLWAEPRATLEIRDVEVR